MSLKSAQEEHDRRWAAYNAGTGPRPGPRHDTPRDVDGRPMHGYMAANEEITARDIERTNRIMDRIGKAQEQRKASNVEHPPHYTWHPSGVEAIAIIEEFPHNLAAAMGYIWRADHKGRFREDIEKAIWHLRRELARREKAK